MIDLRKFSQNVLLKDFLLLLAVTSFVLLIKLGIRPVVVWDEGLYCGTTQDMQFHSQWLFPTVNGEFSVRYGKPPLANWFHGVSAYLLGWSKFSLRLPTALGAIAQVLLVWLTGILLAGRWVGLVSACLLLLSRNFIGMGRTIWLENLVAPFFAAALLCYGRTFFAASRLPISGTVLAALFSALAILTKQSFGLFAPAAIVVVELLMRRPGFIRRLLVYGGVCLLACGWWFVATAAVVGEASWQSWFGYHIYQRLTETVEGHELESSSFAFSLEWIMDGTPWAVGLLGWAYLTLKTPKNTETATLAYLWSALLAWEFLIVGIVSKTFLLWYQFVITLPLAIGCAYLIVQSFTQRYPAWIRWLIPLLILTNRLLAVKRDAVLAAVVFLGLIYLFEKYQWKQFLKPILAGFLVVLSGLFALRAADSFRGQDVRALLAQRLNPQAQVVVIADNPIWRIWKCYLPQAKTVAGPIPCDRIQPTIAQADTVIVDSQVPACPLPGFTSVQKVERIMVFKKI